MPLLGESLGCYQGLFAGNRREGHRRWCQGWPAGGALPPLLGLLANKQRPEHLQWPPKSILGRPWQLPLASEANLPTTLSGLAWLSCSECKSLCLHKNWKQRGQGSRKYYFTPPMALLNSSEWKGTSSPYLSIDKYKILTQLLFNVYIRNISILSMTCTTYLGFKFLRDNDKLYLTYFI